MLSSQPKTNEPLQNLFIFSSHGFLSPLLGKKGLVNDVTGGIVLGKYGVLGSHGLVNTITGHLLMG